MISAGPLKKNRGGVNCSSTAAILIDTVLTSLSKMMLMKSLQCSAKLSQIKNVDYLVLPNDVGTSSAVDAETILCELFIQ